MDGYVKFSAQCPACKNEADQGRREPDEIRRLLRQDSLSFYCGLCDHEWEPSHQELANVELLLSQDSRTGVQFGSGVYDKGRIRKGE